MLTCITELWDLGPGEEKCPSSSPCARLLCFLCLKCSSACSECMRMDQTGCAPFCRGVQTRLAESSCWGVRGDGSKAQQRRWEVGGRAAETQPPAWHGDPCAQPLGFTEHWTKKYGGFEEHEGSVVPDFGEELEYCVMQNVFWSWLSSRGLTPPAGHLLLSIPRFLSPQAWLTHHSPLQVTDLGSTRHRRFGKKTHPAKPPKM